MVIYTPSPLLRKLEIQQEARDFKVWLGITLPHIVLMLLPVKLLFLNCVRRKVNTAVKYELFRNGPKLKENKYDWGNQFDNVYYISQ